MTDNSFSTSNDEPLIVTDGIDIKNWDVKVPNQDVTITYSIWDFAGQTVYYNTHQVSDIFLRARIDNFKIVR